MNRRRDLTQRALDVLLAGALLVVTAPLWPLIYVAVRLDSPGPAIFRGERMGRDAATFPMLKFRSMRHASSRSGPAITVGGDPRVTRVGRLLRATKLDELPQLLNVLRGDMSLVGWRPEDPKYRDRYPGELSAIFSFRPGITGPASLAFRHEEAVLAGLGEDPESAYLRDILPKKVSMDLDYCRRATLRSDVRILLETVRSVARRPS